MMSFNKACMAGLALLGAVSFSATADARKGYRGHPGGHYGHVRRHYFGSRQHSGWGGVGYGFIAAYWGPPRYAYYDYSGDCYRVYRRGRSRVICD
jgi:hypothetical protein